MATPLKSLPPPTSRPGTKLRTPSLKQCQIDTPRPVVRFAWDQVMALRKTVGTVLDLGAGDGVFAGFGRYASYLGYEIDPNRIPPTLPPGARIDHSDALDVTGLFDVAIGNPPYIRNQDIDAEWRSRAARLVEAESGIKPDLRMNLYAYFLWLALLRTQQDGLVAHIVPADWIVRPSTRRLRDFIDAHGWHVSVFFFSDPQHLFPRVKTSITLSIVDKAEASGWQFYSVSRTMNVLPRSMRSSVGRAMQPFHTAARRTTGLRASRGFSPGSQKVFVLTEGERIAHQISRSSVVPCITTMRGLPRGLKALSEDAFGKHFVRKNRRCWLLKTARAPLSVAVTRWLVEAPESVQKNSTCGGRVPWYRFDSPPIPAVLYNSGFSRHGPLFLTNPIGARAVGAVHGIFDARNPRLLAADLRSVDFANSRFPHASRLFKVEISEMNLLLARLRPSEVIEPR